MAEDLQISIRNFFFLFFLLIHGSLYYLYGQSTEANFQKLTTSSGLTNNTVYSLVQDDLGFIWAGTKNGLHRFDGYNFRNFGIPMQSNEQLTNPTIYELFKDRDGLIWIGLKDLGLWTYDPAFDEFKLFPMDSIVETELTTNSVQVIYEDSRNWFWIGTYGSGVLVLNEKKELIYQFCTFCNTEESAELSNDFVFDFEEDEYGNVFIATAGRGLNLFDLKEKNIRTVHAPDEEDMNSFSKSICFDQSNSLWIGTEGNGLYRYIANENKWKYYRSDTPENKISSNIITDIQIDTKGILWISTDGGGLDKFDLSSESIQHFRYNSTQTESLNTDALYDLYFDNAGNLWIGTFNGGVNVLKTINPPFYSKRNFYEEKKLGLRSVLSIEEDGNGRVWLGTDGGGIFYFDLNHESLNLQNASKLVEKEQFNEVVTCIQPSENKGFWYGTFAMGLHYYDSVNGTIKHFIHDDDKSSTIAHNNVWDLEMDAEGGLWIGTLGAGIDYLAKGSSSFEHFGTFENELTEVQVIDLLLDNKNEYLWIATESRGLNRLDVQTKQIVHYQSNSEEGKQISSDNLLSLFEDKRGNLWIISDVGIDKLDIHSGVIQPMNLSYQFDIETLISIEEDKHGYLWTATTKGIHRIDPRNNEIVEIGTDLGLDNNMFNPKASLRLSDGRIIFGGVSGYSIIVPENFQLNKNKAVPVFTDLKISNRSVEIGYMGNRAILNKNLNDKDAKVQLSYRDRGITFEFSTTEYTNPKLNKFAYMLEGFEEEWNYVDANQRSIFYANLEGGNYILQLKAANSSGVWNNEEIRKLQISVQPPFWERTWFIIFSILFIIASVSFIIRLSLNRQKVLYEHHALEQSQQILQLKNQNLEQEVQNKKAELNASILQMAHKNEFLAVLKDRIKKLQSKHESKSKKPLRSIINFINTELKQEDYWDKFQLVFNQTFQDFIKQLETKHPGLTQNEQRLSCFVKMKFSNQEIASLLNITINGVEQAKYRLKKKLRLEKTENLNQYIQQFGTETI